jgi:hypothetical protein
MTYAKLAKMSSDDISKISAKLVILGQLPTPEGAGLKRALC